MIPGLRDRLERGLSEHPFEAPWWLCGPHAQTIWSPLFRRQRQLTFELENLATPDADELRLHTRPGEPGTPHVLLLHGLEGSLRSNYTTGLARALGAAGWGVRVLEFRSCGGSLNRATRFYHSGETTDLDFVVDELVRREPGRPLFLCGFSLGGNVVAKWLGEQADDAPAEVVGGAAISPPFDLTLSGPAIDRALGGLYVRRFLRSLIPKALEKADRYPGLLDIEAVRRCRNFEDFDTHVTARLHGFEDAHDYWRRSGCGQFLAYVRRPLLLIAAADDPFNPEAGLPRNAGATNSCLFSCFPRRGGHVGFVSGRPWRTHHWAEDQVARFFGLLHGLADPAKGALTRAVR